MYAADIMTIVLCGGKNLINVQVKHWGEKNITQSVQKERLIEHISHLTDLQTLISRSVS